MTGAVLHRRGVVALIAGLVLARAGRARAAPAQGFGLLQGLTFIAPALGFAVVLPDGFGLELADGNLLGASPDGTLALRLDAVRLKASQSLRQYMSSGWFADVDARTIESFLIHGISAVTATARNDKWNYRVFLIRFGSAVYRLIFAAHALTPQLDSAFRASAESFRRLTDAEIAQAMAH